MLFDSKPAPKRRRYWLWLSLLFLAAVLAFPRVVRRRDAGRTRAEAAQEMVEMLMAFDKNGDGKLDRSELPERMQGLVDRGDTDHDGFLTTEEIRKLADLQAPVWAANESRGDRR